jgi:hypothetical protein
MQMRNENPVDRVVRKAHFEETAAGRFAAIDQQTDFSDAIEKRRMASRGRPAIANAETFQRESVH